MKRYLLPTGWGDGLPLAGGPLRFSRVVPIVRDGDWIERQPAVDPASLGSEWHPRLHALAAPRAPLAGLAMNATHVMGILNVTPDSFSDGGRLAEPAAAADAARAMTAAGAAVVDLGGESTRPGAATVDEAEELARVVPVLDALAGDGLTLSIDTRKAAVMRAALERGASLVNDVSALTHDPGALAVVAAAGAPVVLMHHRGEPATMQDDPHYADPLTDVLGWLAARIDAAVAAGVNRARIVVDPGVGFGKTLDHNLALLRGLAALHGLGCPVLLGASRKATIGALAGGVPVGERLPGSLALALHGAARGCQFVRVHDVPETVQALRVWEAVAGVLPEVSR